MILYTIFLGSNLLFVSRNESRGRHTVCRQKRIFHSPFTIGHSYCALSSRCMPYYSSYARFLICHFNFRRLSLGAWPREKEKRTKNKQKKKKIGERKTVTQKEIFMEGKVKWKREKKKMIRDVVESFVDNHGPTIIVIVNKVQHAALLNSTSTKRIQIHKTCLRFNGWKWFR